MNPKNPTSNKQLTTKKRPDHLVDILISKNNSSKKVFRFKLKEESISNINLPNYNLPTNQNNYDDKSKEGNYISLQKINLPSKERTDNEKDIKFNITKNDDYFKFLEKNQKLKRQFLSVKDIKRVSSRLYSENLDDIFKGNDKEDNIFNKKSLYNNCINNEKNNKDLTLNTFNSEDHYTKDGKNRVTYKLNKEKYTSDTNTDRERDIHTLNKRFNYVNIIKTRFNNYNKIYGDDRFYRKALFNKQNTSKIRISK